MGTSSIVAAFASGLRRLARFTPPVLVIVVMFGCAAGIAYALVGNGYTVYSWGTKTDTTGTDIGAMSNRTCFLCGVAGNLSMGSQQGFGCGQQGKESRAWAADKFPPTGNYWLMAHGGACSNQVNQTVWYNNPVNAQATCFWTTTGLTGAEWMGGTNNNLPVKITGLNAGNSNVRQCFLSSLWGVGGAWDGNSRFARVRRVTATDNNHPTTGWYVEANLPESADGSHPRVEGRCVDFPKGTVITTGTAPVIPATETYTLTNGGGIKACALTGIMGAFNVNSYTDGVTMNFPAQINGNWSLTVTAGKFATWACAR